MTSGNEILDKNLDAIGKYNSALKTKLLNLTHLTNNIQLIETELKEPNLTYNGLELHSKKGAESEAKAIFNTVKDDIPCIHFILGMGLGFVFKEFCVRAQGKIILYESNLEILRVTLELVDFSKELNQSNVKLVSDYEELKQIYYDAYEYKMTVDFVILDSYKKIYGAEAQKILDKIGSTTNLAAMHYQYLKEKCTDHLFAIFDNFSYTLDETPLHKIKDIYVGKTAMIVSAGPTLDSNIETIKRYRNKVIIFCVGTALKTLIKNNIIPDFLNIIENIDCSAQVKGIDVSKLTLILEPSTNNAFHILKTKQKFIYPSKIGPWGKYWSSTTEVDNSLYSSCPSVALSAINCAKILGFKKMVLVGQDLAYVNNSCYSKDSAYSDLICVINKETGKPEYQFKDYDNYIKSTAPNTENNAKLYEESHTNKTKESDNSLCMVKGITGEMIPTKQGFAVFIDQFTDFAMNNKEMELINTSLIGAQIDGFKNISLDEALENCKNIDKIDITVSPDYNISAILKKLNNDKQLLHEVSCELKKAEKLLTANKNNNKQPLSLEQLQVTKELIGMYRNLYAKHITNNPLFNLISLEENMDLEYKIKKTLSKKDDNLLINWFSALEEYYPPIIKKVDLIISKIEKTISEISKKA